MIAFFPILGGEGSDDPPLSPGYTHAPPVEEGGRGDSLGLLLHSDPVLKEVYKVINSKHFNTWEKFSCF